MREFPTGATRDSDSDKLDYEGFTSSITVEALDNYTLRQRDIAWAAGLFEGEGCVYLKKNPKRIDGTYSFRPALEIKHTDNDVLQRFKLIIGLGKIRGPYWAKKSTKPFWSWIVENVSESTKAACMLIPYMGARRTVKFIEVFGNFNIEKKTGIPGTVLEVYAKYLHKHRIQADGKYRESDNWKKGIPKSAYIESMFRHFVDVLKEHQGKKTVNGKIDSLCAVIFNAFGYLFEELRND